MGKEEKLFPLTSKDNCIIYLYRIISTCELCMDKFKKYNSEGEAVLEEYKGESLIPHDLFGDLWDKTTNIMCYLLNMLGDLQASSISYLKFRQQVERQINKGNLSDVTLAAMDAEMQDMLSQFNRMRNWQNHVPESLLVAEMEEVAAGKMEFKADPVTIYHHNYVTYEYYESLQKTNILFCQNAKKIIQMAEKDYSLLMGKSIQYPREYTDRPISIEKASPTMKSASRQGIKPLPE